MDARIFSIYGARPSRLRREDLPLVTRALVAYFRHHGKAGVGIVRHVNYVRLWGPNFSVVIMKEDWDKIEPFVQNETFNPILTETDQPAAYRDPLTYFAEPVVDVNDRGLYNFILGRLQLIFTDTYPTSNV